MNTCHLNLGGPYESDYFYLRLENPMYVLQMYTHILIHVRTKEA